MAASVFLSHSTRDNTFCERLALDLVEYDVKVWYDQWEIKVGDSLRSKIATGIETNDYLAVVLSKASVQSQWVQQELNAALAKELRERQVFVLPLLIEECKIPTFLEDKKWADFRTDYDRGLKDLLDVLGVKKRKKRRSVSSPATAQRRNDELALDPGDFEEWFLDRLEEGNEIRVQRYFWNWREAVRAINAQLSPDEIPAKQIDLDHAGQALLDKLAISGNVLVRYSQERWFAHVMNLLYDAYLLVNGWGIQDGASVDWNVRPSVARCRILDVVFALGAAAIDAGQYSMLPAALNRNTPDQGFWERRSWFRYALTMAARGDPQKNADWYLPVGRAVEYIANRPTLRQYFSSQDEILSTACQFDLMQALYWILHSEDEDLWDSYPTCALYSPSRVEPLLRDIIQRREPAAVLGEFADDGLAAILRAFPEAVKQRTFYTARGWGEDGWSDPVVRQFLAANPPPPPSVTA